MTVGNNNFNFELTSTVIMTSKKNLTNKELIYFSNIVIITGWLWAVSSWNK